MLDEDKFDQEFETLFKQSKVFAVIVGTVVIAFFAVMIAAAVIGVIWLGRQL